MNQRRFVSAVLPTLFVFIVALSPALAQIDGQAVQAYRTDTGINPVTVDTTLIQPAIDNKYVFHPVRPENPLAPPKAGPKNFLRAGQANANLKRGNLSSKWPAVGATGWTPADCTLAVGPNHIVETVNSSIAFFSKTGTLQFQQTSTTFFSGLGAGTFQFDPRVIYDRVHGRFVIIMDEEDDASQTSKILLAVSDDSDPNGTWYKYRLEAKLTQGGSSYWLDYPGFGYNKDAYVVSGNMFGFTSGFAGAQFMVIPSANILSGGPATVQYLLDPSGGSVQVCEMIDPAATTVYAVCDFTTTSLRCYALTNLTGTPAFTTASVTVPSYATPTRDANSTGAKTMDALDGRIFEANWRNGSLVCSHCVQSGNLRARWYQINTNSWPTSGSPSLNQSGEVSGAVDYHMPAINQNSAGAISIIFSRSSTGITGDIMYAGRKASDAAGTMGAPNLLESSAGSAYADGRWGDYFKVDVDPVDDTTFYGVAMDVNSSNGWKTSIFSWTISSTVTIPPAPTNLTATAGNGQVSLAWNASTGATSYNVKRSTTNGGPYSTVASVSGTSYVNSGLTNGTTYYFVVTAVNSAGESGNSNQASATPNATQQQQLLLNPGFESGAVSWTQTAGVITNSASRPAHAGSWKAWLDGYGSAHTDSLYQQVTIPSTVTSATLSFWIRIDTAETTTSIAYDTLKVQIRNSSNAVLATLATYSNLNKNSSYVQKSFDLSAYKGQTIRVYLLGVEDSSLQTSFVVDDFALNVQ